VSRLRQDVRFEPTGQWITFTLSADADFDYEMAGSANLIDWDRVLQLPKMAGPTQITNPAPEHTVAVFYRARMLER
jgi:hypothetical protein